MSRVVALKEGKVDLDQHTLDLDEANAVLAKLGAEDRVAWALRRFAGEIVMSSSFGAQSAVLLHMVSRQKPDIPVILIDTGYLFPETYRFIDDLTQRLNLNLKVYRSEISPAWQEARYGKLWEQGREGIETYNQINKVEPMQRALSELGASAWLAGIRRSQSGSRQERDLVEEQNGRTKIHPIVDWNDKDIYLYLKAYDLPYHPLWHEGYVSIGDVHTTTRLADGMDEEDTRFFGLMRECGLHDRV